MEAIINSRYGNHQQFEICKLPRYMKVISNWRYVGYQKYGSYQRLKICKLSESRNMKPTKRYSHCKQFEICSVTRTIRGTHTEESRCENHHNFEVWKLQTVRYIDSNTCADYSLYPNISTIWDIEIISNYGIDNLILFWTIKLMDLQVRHEHPTYTSVHRWAVCAVCS
jgi:hypothetical protein